MRWLLGLFLIISLALHLFLLDLLHLKPEKTAKQKPIEVRLVPPKGKDQQNQPPVVQPQQKNERPTPQTPDNDYNKNMNLKDDLDTSLKQSKPALQGNRQMIKAGKPDIAKTPAPSKPAPQAQKNASPQNTAQQGQQRPVNAPTVSSGDQGQAQPQNRQGLSQKTIDDIMHPRDVINKYANNQAGDNGQDTVSMEYVRARYQSYFAKFARRLYQVWVYPSQAGMRGEQGTVLASFIISRDGTISSIRILRSSGYSDLDNEVIEALKKMYGVPLPESYNLDMLNVNASFRYIIGGGFEVY